MRHLFSSESPLVLKQPTGSDLTAVLFPAAAFTIWTDSVSGTDVSNQCTAVDGVSTLNRVTNSFGEIPDFRGPDDGTELLFLDVGGDKRTPIRAIDTHQIDPIWQDVDTLKKTAGQGGTGGGSGLPANTTLESIPDGTSRLALSSLERTKLARYPDNPLTVGTASNQAKPGNYVPNPIDIGAVQNVTGFGRVWGRSATEGLPTAAQGATEGDWCFMDAT